MFQLAQDLPDPDLLRGSVQDILAWIILALIVLYSLTCTYFLLRQGKSDNKYDVLQHKLFKALSRSNRALEGVANLPPPEEDDE